MTGNVVTHWPTALRQILIALWVGSLWTVGCLVAPTLFLSLSDTILAGTIAGKIFRVEAWLSVGMAVVIAILIKRTETKRIETNRTETQASPKSASLHLVGAMLACTLIGYFGLQPFMAALRLAAPGGVLTGSARTHFGILHGIASAIYFIESGLGLLLLYRSSRMGVEAINLRKGTEFMRDSPFRR